MSESMKLKFDLIASKAKLMSMGLRKGGSRPWAGDIQQACGEIARLASEISREARRYDASDR